MKQSIFTSKIHKTSFLAYATVFCITIIIIAVLYGYLIYTTIETGQNNQKELTAKINTQVDSFLSNMDRIALQVMGNPSILHSFEQASSQAPLSSSNFFNENIFKKQALQKVLLGINGPNLSVGRISIYNDSGDYVSYGSYAEDEAHIENMLSQIEYKAFMNQINSKTQKKMMIGVHSDTWNQSGTEIISVYRPLKNMVSNKNIALIETQIYLEKLYELISFKEIDSMNLQVFDSDGQMIFPEIGKQNIKDFEQLKEYDFSTPNSMVLKNNKNYSTHHNEIIVAQTGSEYLWTVVSVQPTRNLMHAANRFLIVLVVILIIIFIIMAFFLFWISNHLAKPLVQLNQNIRNVTLENLTLSLENSENMDVVENLNQNFQAMFHRLSLSMQNEMDANLLALQAQMNPHFLYNVLAVIGAAGVEDGSMKVALLCEKLSKMLRYSSSYTSKTVTLREELQYASYYLDLMKARYENKLNYSIIVTGNTDHIFVPKLIIQPIVENCFKHAFKNAGYLWNIRVIVTAAESGWKVVFEDNGCGFQESEKEKVLQQVGRLSMKDLDISQLEAGGLGLVNTIVRLKLLYGDDTIYGIETNENGCTIVYFGVFINAASFLSSLP